MKLSIRYKILLAFLLVLTLSYISQVIAFFRTDKFIRDQTLALLSDKSQVAANEIQSFLANVELAHLGISELYQKDQTDTEKYLAVEHTQLLIRQSPLFNTISILSVSGKELLKVNSSGQVPPESLDFEIITSNFSTAIKGQTAVSKIYFEDNSKMPYVNIFTPMIDGKGETVGVIKSRLQLERLWDLIAQIKPGNEGFAYIVDEEGRLIAHPDHQLLLTAPNFASRAIVKNLITKNELGSSDFYYQNESSTKVIANGTTIPVLNWTIIMEQPVSEAFYQRNFLSYLFFITIIASLVLLVTISLFLTNQLTEPVNLLQETVNSFEYGKLDRVVNIKSGDEIESLGKSFNNMAAKLKLAFKELEGKINQLEKQKVRLDQSAKLLLRRDLDLREINDKLESEKEHAEAERNKFSIVLAGVKDAVIAVDTKHNIVIFNSAAQKVTGLHAKNVIGGPIDKALKFYEHGKEIPPEIYGPISTNTFEGIVYKKENLKMVSSLGKSAYINVVTGQIREGVAVNLGAIITFSDVSQEKELEKMKLEFVSMAAHELRTPLTTIQGYISFLQDENTLNKLNEEEREFLSRAQTSSLRLTQLIENLLVVSNIEKGTMSIKPQPISLETIVERLCNEMSPLAKAKELTLTCEMPTKPLPEVMADPMRIGEVVTNLVGNAINYTQKGGIAISFYQDKNDVVCTISDTGVGIPKEAQSHLFTKFFRIQGVLQSGSKGTGLGLYISKNIIEAHHGKIWFQSEPDKGTDFFFSLPTVVKGK